MTHGYICEPEKNTVCDKRRCWVNGGECKIASHKEFAESEKTWCCHLHCPHIGDGTTCKECWDEDMTNKEATQ